MNSLFRRAVLIGALLCLPVVADASNSGPGGGGDDRADRVDNSGPGNAEDRASSSSSDDRDNSGRGNAEDRSESADRSDDRSGSNSGSDRDVADRSDDRDVDNSGRGNAEDRDVADRGDSRDVDNSGRGNAEDRGVADRTDDRSGSNSGDERLTATHTDSSGPGSGYEVERREVIAFGEIEHDREGREWRAGEALLVGNLRDLEAAEHRGYEVLSARRLSALGQIVARVRLPHVAGIDEELAALRHAAPHANISPNHVYRPSRDTVVRGTSGGRAALSPVRGVLGIIDTGADAGAVTGRLIQARSFAHGDYTPREHGTIIAGIAAGAGMRVQVADVFDTDSTGAPLASADAIAAAIDWMVASRIPVINISIEGPQNAVLAQVIRRAVARGHIIVAAAGNGGPLAAPAFPGAFAGVVAVTAVDNNGRVYRRANRGDYVSFAARGVELPVAYGDEGARVSGTSFAAPTVAAVFAEQLATPSPREARALVQRLSREAIDLGAPGRDPIYGWGELRPTVGQAARVDVSAPRLRE